MAEASTGISRRSTRLFLREHEALDAGTSEQLEYGSRHGSEENEQERSQKQQKSRRTSPPATNIKAPVVPLVDFWKDLSGVLPSTLEDVNDSGMRFKQSLQISR